MQDFLADRIKPVTASLLSQATGDDSLARLLRTSIKNWLIDRARETGTGPMRRSIEKVLSTAPDFERVAAGEAGAGRWRLTDSEAEPWGGNIDDLTAAAWSVRDIRVPKWSSPTRRPPIADRESLIAVIRAVLARAEGSVETSHLVAVFANRFAAALDPLVVLSRRRQHSIDFESVTPDPEDTVLAEEVALDVATAAAEIAGRLTEAERQIVPILDDDQQFRQNSAKNASGPPPSRRG